VTMTSVPAYSDFSDIAKQVLTIEDREKIMALREAVLQLQAENLTLKSEKTELEAKLKVAAELTFKDQFYWKEGDATPFCPRCWDKDRLAIHVSPEAVKGFQKLRTCPECSRDYVVGSVDVVLPRPIGGAISHRRRAIDGL